MTDETRESAYQRGQRHRAEMMREAAQNANPQPSLDKRLGWLEADASAQRTAILKLEREVRWHRVALWFLSGFVYLGILWRLFL